MIKSNGTKIKISCSEGIVSAKQAADMAREALISGEMDKADIVFAFCSSQSNPHEFYNGIRKVVGKDTLIVGGSAIGLISNDFLSYKERTSGFAIIQSDVFKCRSVYAEELDRDEDTAGFSLARKIEQGPDDKALLVFYDSIKTPPSDAWPPVMNSSSYLLKGMNRANAFAIPIIGAGLVGDYGFSPTSQFCGNSIGGRRVVGTVFSGNIGARYCITHGCTPLDGSYHTITKIEGPIVYELDGKPVVGMINEMFGSDEWQKQHPVDYLTLGVNLGDRYGAFDEGTYINRLITGITPDEKGIIMFEPDLHKGMEIQFMTRDAEEMILSARRNSAVLMESIEKEDKMPVFGLYIDCAGRAGRYSNTEAEEASEIQEIMNRHKTPFIGFYSGVEIAPFQGISRGLDWTGVLFVLTVDK